MNQTVLHILHQWFSDYCSSFYTANQADQKNISIKEEHTKNVCANMREIGRDLGLDERRSMLAEFVALFHDVGRFPQYRLYGTFRDSSSTNHAALGARVLTEHNVLALLPASEADLVIRAISLHNVFAIPAGLNDELLLLVRMIRDADKLDIWRVFIDYYSRPDEDRASAVGLGLPDTPRYSSGVLASVMRREMVQLSALSTLNDFKLLQLAWIFDLNFSRSLQLVQDRGYIDGLAATLPRVQEITEAVHSIRDYVDGRIGPGGATGDHAPRPFPCSPHPS
jgi:hypothetical protein